MNDPEDLLKVVLSAALTAEVKEWLTRRQQRYFRLVHGVIRRAVRTFQVPSLPLQLFRL